MCLEQDALAKPYELEYYARTAGAEQNSLRRSTGVSRAHISGMIGLRPRDESDRRRLSTTALRDGHARRPRSSSTLDQTFQCPSRPSIASQPFGIGWSVIPKTSIHVTLLSRDVFFTHAAVPRRQRHELRQCVPEQFGDHDPPAEFFSAPLAFGSVVAAPLGLRWTG